MTDRQLHMIRERGGMDGCNFATLYLNAGGRADGGTGSGSIRPRRKPRLPNYWTHAEGYLLPAAPVNS